MEVSICIAFEILSTMETVVCVNWFTMSCNVEVEMLNSVDGVRVCIKDRIEAVVIGNSDGLCDKIEVRRSSAAD